MTALADKVLSATLARVEIVYLDRATARWWNQRKDKQDTAMFCGWYWVRGQDEEGPYRSRSAAVRAAYYRTVLHREPPAGGQQALADIPKPKPAPKGRRKTTEARA